MNNWRSSGELQLPTPLKCTHTSRHLRPLYQDEIAQHKDLTYNRSAPDDRLAVPLLCATLFNRKNIVSLSHDLALSQLAQPILYPVYRQGPC